MLIEGPREEALAKIKHNTEAHTLLTELTDLLRKHSMSLCGCGCCGSPGLFRDSPRFDLGEVKYDFEKDTLQFDLEADGS